MLICTKTSGSQFFKKKILTFSLHPLPLCHYFFSIIPLWKEKSTKQRWRIWDQLVLQAELLSYSVSDSASSCGSQHDREKAEQELQAHGGWYQGLPLGGGQRKSGKMFSYIFGFCHCQRTAKAEGLKVLKRTLAPQLFFSELWRPCWNV